MRTGLSFGILVCAWGMAPLRAADAPSPSGGNGGGTAPTLQDYRDRPDAGQTGSNPSPGAMLEPSGSSPSPAPSITKPEDDNWLQKGVDAERKASELKAAGKAPDSPLKLVAPVDPLASKKPVLPDAPQLRTPSDNDPARTAAKQPNGFAPIVPIAGAGATNNPNGFKPLIQGLSGDATKPLAQPTGTSTNGSSALSAFQSIRETNPDVTRPLYLGDFSSRNDNAEAAFGTAPSPIDAPKLPSGYEIPNAPGSRPAGAVPIATAAPLAPIAPRAVPTGSSALSAFTPIQPITAPVAPAPPVAPTARDIAPKAGPGSAMKVKDPVGADLPFIR